MALIQSVKSEDVEEIGDITSNLETLQFQSALTGEERRLYYLRKRSHALTVLVCAQATAVSTYLNEAR